MKAEVADTILFVETFSEPLCMKLWFQETSLFSSNSSSVNSKSRLTQVHRTIRKDPWRTTTAMQPQTFLIMYNLALNPLSPPQVGSGADGPRGEHGSLAGAPIHHRGCRPLHQPLRGRCSRGQRHDVRREQLRRTAYSEGQQPRRSRLGHRYNQQHTHTHTFPTSS